MYHVLQTRKFYKAPNKGFQRFVGVLLRESSNKNPTVDDINPALPIIRNRP